MSKKEKKAIFKFPFRNSAQFSVTAWIGGECGGGRMHAYVWLDPSNVHLKLP